MTATVLAVTLVGMQAAGGNYRFDQRWKLKGEPSVGATFGVLAGARLEVEFRSLAYDNGLSVVEDCAAAALPGA